MLNFDKLALGTAQWGMVYGVANEDGIASDITVRNILNKAQNVGVDLLDTAYIYGKSETILGLNKISKNGFRVITKTMPLEKMGGTDKYSIEEINRTFLRSLAKLQTENVYSLLIHKANDLLGNSGDMLWSMLEGLKSEGLVNKIGCSVYDVTQLNTLIDRYDMELVQLPYNIFNQSYITSGVAEKVKKKKIEVHARSIFLQGLLLIKPNKLPEYFSELYNHHFSFWNECKELNLSPLEATLGFCMANKYIDKVIVGCEKLTQWKEIIVATKKNLDFNTIRSLEKFSIENDSYTNPSNWKI